MSHLKTLKLSILLNLKYIMENGLPLFKSEFKSHFKFFTIWIFVFLTHKISNLIFTWLDLNEI